MDLDRVFNLIFGIFIFDILNFGMCNFVMSLRNLIAYPFVCTMCVPSGITIKSQ